MRMAPSGWFPQACTVGRQSIATPMAANIRDAVFSACVKTRGEAGPVSMQIFTVRGALGVVSPARADTNRMDAIKIDATGMDATGIDATTAGTFIARSPRRSDG